MKPCELLEKEYRGILYEYLLESPAMILGERFKGGVFRPSSKVLRYSQITGALRSELGVQNLHAVGIIQRFNVDFFVYSPQDKVAGRSKVPLTVEVLTDVQARVYVASPIDLPEEFSLHIGGLITKGFGESHLKLVQEIKSDYLKKSIGEVGKKGGQSLATRLPLREEIYKGIFGISRIVKPIYCYMFYPTSPMTGYYELSLKEGSIVIAPTNILKSDYDEISCGWESMSSIDSLVERIAQNPRLRKTKFSSTELNELAEIYEKHGYRLAEVHLRRKMESAKKDQERDKLQTLLYILGLIENSHIPRHIGGYIIKSLNTIATLDIAGGRRY